MRITFDTPFDPDFGIYTRANAGEVLPGAIGPLGWSLVGPGLEEGFRIALCDNLGALPRSADRPFQLVGRFAGYFHLNLSALRLAAERLPGTSAAAVDRQYFGDASLHGLPPYTSKALDLGWKAKAGLATVTTLARFSRQVDRQCAEVIRARRTTKAILENQPAPAELTKHIKALAQLHAQLFGSHVTARALTSSAVELATKSMAHKGFSPDDALRHLATIPDLESAKPGRALWALARRAQLTNGVADLIRSGGTRHQLADSGPEGALMAGAVDEFIVAFGHRGVNEYDPTVPAWEQRPDDVVSILASLLNGGLGAASDVGSAANPEPPAVRQDELGVSRLASVILGNARTAIRRGEITKDNVIRVTHEMRRTLCALAPLIADHLGPEYMALVSGPELDAVVAGEVPAASELENRRREMLAVSDLRLAEWSDGQLRLAQTQAQDQPDESPFSTSGPIRLDGIGGSPGRCQGRARIMSDPYSYFEEGDILVTEVTDTAWTPLFAVAAAVVTDVGGVLSHATIVAREMGIPAVVNTKRATLAIKDGDVVEVDGAAGSVTIIALAANSDPADTA